MMKVIDWEMPIPFTGYSLYGLRNYCVNSQDGFENSTIHDAKAKMSPPMDPII